MAEGPRISTGRPGWARIHSAIKAEPEAPRKPVTRIGSSRVSILCAKARRGLVDFFRLTVTMAHPEEKRGASMGNLEIPRGPSRGTFKRKNAHRTPHNAGCTGFYSLRWPRSLACGWMGLGLIVRGLGSRGGGRGRLGKGDTEDMPYAAPPKCLRRLQEGRAGGSDIIDEPNSSRGWVSPPRLKCKSALHVLNSGH